MHRTGNPRPARARSASSFSPTRTARRSIPPMVSSETWTPGTRRSTSSRETRSISRRTSACTSGRHAIDRDSSMNLNLSPEETRFRDELRAWLQTHAPKQWEQRRDASIEEQFAFLRSWQKTLYDGGWAGVSWPREYGGRGASLIQQVIFWQELARVSAPPMANVIGLGMVGPTIIAFGTEAQKARFL